MSKENITLTGAQFYIEYYKDNDIFDRYIRNLSSNIIVDNDILDVGIEDKIYVVPYSKYNELRQLDTNEEHEINRQND